MDKGSGILERWAASGNCRSRPFPFLRKHEPAGFAVALVKVGAHHVEGKIRLCGFQNVARRRVAAEVGELRAGDVLLLAHEGHGAVKSAEAFARHGASAIMEQAEKRRGESCVLGLAARLGDDGKRGFAVAFKKMQDALEGALQRNFVRVGAVRSVRGGELGFANAGDEKCELKPRHHRTDFGEKCFAQRGDLKKGEVGERLSDVAGVKIDALMRPVVELQPRKRGNDFARVVLALDDDGGEDKERKLRVDVRPRMVAALVNECDEAGSTLRGIVDEFVMRHRRAS